MSAKYWGKTGKYSQLLDEKWNELVPQSGEAETEIGELIRSFGRINYEMFNNGCCNMFHDYNSDEDDSNEIDLEIDQMYGDFFDKISNAINDNLLSLQLEKECENLFLDSNFDKEDWIIDLVGDRVGEIVENYFSNEAS
jgi:hypothetical protein